MHAHTHTHMYARTHSQKSAYKRPMHSYVLDCDFLSMTVWHVCTNRKAEETKHSRIKVLIFGFLLLLFFSLRNVYMTTFVLFARLKKRFVKILISNMPNNQNHKEARLTFQVDVDKIYKFEFTVESVVYL